MGSGLSFGPLHMGMPSLGGRGDRGGSSARGGSSRSDVFYAQLLPLDDIGREDRPLLSKILQSPELRPRYQQSLRQILDEWLSWERLGPDARRWHALIQPVVKNDTHKPWSYQRFVQELDQDLASTDRNGDTPNLKTFITDRAAYLRRQPGLR